MIIGCAGYNECVFNNHVHYVDRITKAVKNARKKYGFSALAFRGFSGAAIAYPVAYKLKMPFILVRKNETDSHGLMVESSNCDFITSYAIIDDFISTGRTVIDIINNIGEKTSDKVYCNLIILYNDEMWNDSFHDDMFYHQDTRRSIPILRAK